MIGVYSQQVKGNTLHQTLDLIFFFNDSAYPKPDHYLGRSYFPNLYAAIHPVFFSACAQLFFSNPS